jgi:hypothetical protein
VDQEDLNVGNLLETKLQRHPDTFIRQEARMQAGVRWLIPTVVAAGSLLLALGAQRWFRFLQSKDR